MTTTETTTDVGHTTPMFDLASTIEALNALPSKRNDKDLKETISSLAPALRAAKERGYNAIELAKWLNERGLKIGPTTLRQYMPKAKPKKERAPKKPPEGAAPAAQVSAAPPQPAPAPAVAAPVAPSVISRPVHPAGPPVTNR